MNLKTIDIIRNELLQQKLKAEVNIEHILMDKNIYPDNKVSTIIDELDKLKDSSLRLSFWEDFINNNIIIPNSSEELEKNTKK